VVRGPAALLGASALALTYFLLAGALPDLGRGDTAILVAGLVGVTLVALVVLALVDCGDSVPALMLLLVGSLMLVAEFDAAGAGPSVVVFESLLAGSAGILLCRPLVNPAVAQRGQVAGDQEVREREDEGDDEADRPV